MYNTILSIFRSEDFSWEPGREASEAAVDVLLDRSPSARRVRRRPTPLPPPRVRRCPRGVRGVSERAETSDPRRARRTPADDPRSSAVGPSGRGPPARPGRVYVKRSYPRPRPPPRGTRRRGGDSADPHSWSAAAEALPAPRRRRLGSRRRRRAAGALPGRRWRAPKLEPRRRRSTPRSPQPSRSLSHKTRPKPYRRLLSP